MLTPIASTSTGHYAALCERARSTTTRRSTNRPSAVSRWRASFTPTASAPAWAWAKRSSISSATTKDANSWARCWRATRKNQGLSALAQSFYEEKRFGDVIEHAARSSKYRDAADDHPTTEQSAKLVSRRTMLGTACIRVNQIFTGRSHFEKVLKLKPDYAPALAGIGESYQLESNYDKAEEYFKKAMAADPKNPQYPLNLALNCHKYRQSPANALPYYKQYYQLGGHDPSVRQWYIEAGGVPEEKRCATKDGR